MSNLDRFSQGLQDRQELEPNIIEHCEGCGEPIIEGEDMRDWNTLYLHDDIMCIANYVRRVTEGKVAGE